MTPKKNKLSPKENSVDERFSNTMFSQTLHKGRKLLVITIEIGNGKQEQLTIYENDNPQEVAEEFCNRHHYERELRDLLQYQIECTIYEAKSKLLQRERSQTYSQYSHDQELEIPLEVTYSENGVYNKISPKRQGPAANNTVSYSQIEEKADEGEPNSEYFNQHAVEDTQNNMRLKEEEEVPEEENEGEGEGEGEDEYLDYGANVPESGRKYVELETEEMPMNINTQSQEGGRKSKQKLTKPTFQNVAQKYLSMRNQFMPTLTNKTIEMATFKVGNVDPAFNRLHTDAKSRYYIKNKESNLKKGKPSSNLPVKMRSDYVSMNHGERLYQRSRINKETLSRKAQKEKKMKEAEELAKISHKPTINEFEHKFYKRSYKVPIPDCLFEVKTKVNEDLEKKKEEYQKKLTEDHTFVPLLNKLSTQIMAGKVKREASIQEQNTLYSPSKCTKQERHTQKGQNDKDADIKK